MWDRSHETCMLKGRVNKARDDYDCAVLLVKQSKLGCSPTRLHTTVQTTRNDLFQGTAEQLCSSQCHISQELSLGYEIDCWHSVWYTCYKHAMPKAHKTCKTSWLIWIEKEMQPQATKSSK